MAFNSLCSSTHFRASPSHTKKKTRTTGDHLVYKKKWWSSRRPPPRLPFSGDTSFCGRGNIVISEPDKAPPEGAATCRHPHRRPNRKILSAPSSEQDGPSTLNAPCEGRAELGLTFTGQVREEQVELHGPPLGRELMLEVRGRSRNNVALVLKKLFSPNGVKSSQNLFKWLNNI